MERKEFELSDEDYEKLRRACEPVPYIVVGGIAPVSRQENANSVWKFLGDKLGFHHMTAFPVLTKSDRFFTAEPKLSMADLIVWAAMFARTNYGQPMPTAVEIRNYRTSAAHGASLEAMVNMVCADYIEQDDHYDMFLEEAKGWMETLENKSIDYVLKTWYEKARVWQEATS